MSIVVHRPSHRDPGRPGDPEPNLADYAAACRAFSPDARLAAMCAPPARGPNIGFEVADRHALNFRSEQAAIRWLGSGGTRLEVTYGDLAMLSSRLANVLDELGVRPGQVICTLLGRVPALYAVALGTLKHRAIFAPLSSLPAAPAIVQQLAACGASVLFTTSRLYRAQLEPSRATLPALEHVVLVDDTPRSHAVPGTLPYPALMRNASPVYHPRETRAEDQALLHFEAASNDALRPIVHTHAAFVMQQAAGYYALDLHPGDVYFPALDPGTVLGTVGGIIAPLANRATVVLDDAPLRADRCHSVLSDERVQVFYASPAVLEAVVWGAPEPAPGRDLSALRVVACSDVAAPDAVEAVERALGRTLHVHLFEPQLGTVILANFPALPVQPGSIGRPPPGIEAALVSGPDRAGEPVDRGEGELVVRTLTPGGARGEWFETGRRAFCSEDGNFWLRT